MDNNRTTRKIGNPHAKELIEYCNRTVEHNVFGRKQRNLEYQAHNKRTRREIGIHLRVVGVDCKCRRCVKDKFNKYR